MSCGCRIVIRIPKLHEPNKTDDRWLCELCGSEFVTAARYAELRAAGIKVLAGFEEGAFCRDTRGDGAGDWAIKALPYLLALTRLGGPA